MAPKNITPYTEKELTILVEEYITQERSEFELKGLHSYIVYWGMEDGRIVGGQMGSNDKEKVGVILDRIVKDGRIHISSKDNTKFIKR